MSDATPPGNRPARLDSWKEIAAYLKRDVTTVQRWERREGLPVHRQQHERQGSVYAYIGELDRWAELRQVSPAPPATERQWRQWPMAAAALLAIITIAATAYFRLHGRVTPSPALPLDIAIAPPAGTGFGRSFALSPDGRQLAVVVRSGAERRLWIRDVYSRSAVPVAGTEGAHHPFWSPDGRQIAYFVDGSLMAVSIAGGPPRTICAAPGGIDGAWSPSGTIVFSRQGLGLSAVAAAGGEIKAVTTVATDSGETGHLAPHFLPDGRHLLFLADADAAAAHVIGIADVEGGTRERLLAGITSKVFFSQGYLVFVRDGAVWARRFDAARRTVSGDEFLVIGDVQDTLGDHTVGLSVAASGGLAFWPAEARRTRLTWYDETGMVSGYAGIAAEDEVPSIAPDGKRIAVARYNRAETNRDIWIVEHDGDQGRKLTGSPANEDWPVWSPDGRLIAYASDRNGLFDVAITAADGGGNESLLRVPGVDVMPMHWNAIRGLLFRHRDRGAQTWDLWITQSLEAPGAPEQTTAFNECAASISPDGRWLAFETDDTGRREVYVAGFSDARERPIRVSRNGGRDPRWARDGRALYYITPDDELVRVATDASSRRPDASTARILFKLPPVPRHMRVYDVGPDNRLLVNALSTTDTTGTIAVTTRWAIRQPRD